MRALKIIIALVYALAVAAVLVSLAALLGILAVPAVDELVGSPGARIVLTACLPIVGLGALIAFVRALTARAEPQSMRPKGNQDIEVSLGALTSTARAAAERFDDVLIERVKGRIIGRDRSAVRLTIEAISLTNADLDATAHRMQERIVAACAQMLGDSGVTARVRFLPGKTTTTIKEIDHEQA